MSTVLIDRCTLTELPVDGCACPAHRNIPDPPAPVKIVERSETRG